MTNNMPAKVWINSKAIHYTNIFKLKKQDAAHVDYIRADIHEAQLAERDRRIKELEMKGD